MDLKRKLTLLFILLLAVVLSLGLWFFRSAVREHIVNDKLDQMKYYANVLDKAYREKGIDALEDRVKLGLLPYRVTLLDGKGIVLYDTSGEISENHKNRPEIKQALSEGSGNSMRYSSTQKIHMLYYALKLTPFEGSDKGDVYLRLSLSFKTLTLIESSLTSRFFVNLAIAGFMVFLFWFWASKRIFRPLEHIVQISQDVSIVQNTSFPLFKEVEFQRLSLALNDMASRLRNADEELLKSHDELVKIVEALPVGVVVADKARKVVCLNGTALSLLGIKGVGRGDSVEMLLVSQEIYKIFEDASKGNVFLPIEEGRTLNVSASRLSEGRLMVLSDVSEEQALEDTRRGFTIEAGHELQTPLTSVRAAAEMLLEDLREDGESGRLVRTILQQQERMTNLIDDLLLLVKLEKCDYTDKSVLHKEHSEEDLSELLTLTIGEYRENPAARGIVFEKFLVNEAPFMCNRSEILRALSNLMDNAVHKCNEKYNSEPGGVIRLTLEDDGEAGSWRFLIEDSGPGFDPKRAEKVRADLESQTLSYYGGGETKGKWGSGGHGLGLAITARVVRTHGGIMELLKEPSSLGGAAFRITLPRAPGP